MAQAQRDIRDQAACEAAPVYSFRGESNRRLRHRLGRVLYQDRDTAHGAVALAAPARKNTGLNDVSAADTMSMNHTRATYLLFLLSSSITLGCSTSRPATPGASRPVVSASETQQPSEPHDLLAESDANLRLNPASLLADSAKQVEGTELKRAATLAAAGAYQEAMQIPQQGPQPSAEQTRWLEPRLGLWEVLRYTDADGYLHYDEDMKMREPGALIGTAHARTMERDVSFQRGTVLSMAGTLLMFPPGRTHRANTASNVTKQMFPDGPETCARGVEFAFPVAWASDAATARRQLLVTISEPERARDMIGVGASWLMLGDAVAAPNSTPFQLNLLPYMSTSAVQQRSGVATPEFAPISRSAVEEACTAYRRAAAAWQGQPCARCAAHPAFRQSYLQAVQSASCELGASPAQAPFAQAAGRFSWPPQVAQGVKTSPTVKRAVS